MRGKLVLLSLLSFGLLMYFAHQEIYFPYIFIPFIGFGVTVFMWPQKYEPSGKLKSQGYEYSEPDHWDVAGKSIKALKNRRDNGQFDNDVDIEAQQVASADIFSIGLFVL